MATLGMRDGVKSSRRPRWVRLTAPAAPSVVTGILLIGSSLGLGMIAAIDKQLAETALAAGILLLVMAIRPVYLGVAAVGLIFLVNRLGPGGVISISDALVAVAGLLAIPALARSTERRRLSPALRSLAAYLVLLLPSVVLNQAVRSDIEWLHRVILVGGSLLAGAWVMREGKTTVALRWLLVVALFFAFATIATSVTTGFKPAYPLGFNKNFVGSVMATTLLAVLIVPTRFVLPERLRTMALPLLAVGVLASQSRGGMLAIVLGVLIWLFRTDREQAVAHSWRGKAIGVIVGIGLAYFAYTSVTAQLADKATLNTSSLGSRFSVEARTQQIWRTSPVVGVGLRYFNSGVWGPDAIDSNNAVDNELAESGVVGLAGFVILHCGLAWALLQRKSALATAGLAVVLGHLLHGMVDIYWSAGVSALPMILAGMGLAENPVLKVSDNPKVEHVYTG